MTEVLNKYYENLSLLASIPVVFIAENQRPCLGCGRRASDAHDMRFAGPAAVFSAPEASLGLIHVGALQWLVDSVGPGRTMEYMLSSARLSLLRRRESAGLIRRSLQLKD